MQLDVILLSFIIAFIRGGRITELPKFHKLYLLIISLMLQFSSFILPSLSSYFVSVSYLTMLLFFYFNKEYEDIRIFLIGWFLNALVIWLNMGRMPVDIEVAKHFGNEYFEKLIQGEDYKHILMTEKTKLPFLADIVYIPFPIPRIISIGDVFTSLGAFLMVQRFMNKPISLIKIREGK